MNKIRTFFDSKTPSIASESCPSTAILTDNESDRGDEDSQSKQACEYADIGCDFKGSKRELERHLTQNTKFHLSIAVSRLRLNKTICTNGLFIWRLDNFRERFAVARHSKEETSIRSEPFYTSQYGYKLQIKVCLCGQGTGRGTHLSLFLIILKGEYDNLLFWPFTNNAVFHLLDQDDGRNHKREEIRPNLSLKKIRSAFAKPIEEENRGIGNPVFISHEELLKRGYAMDNQLFIKFQLE